MVFITDEDLQNSVANEILQQIINGNDKLADNSENTAIGMVRDMLADRYDIDTEIAKTANERHPVLKMWVTAITVYLMYAHIHDDEIPARIEKDYDDALKTIKEIARGKIPTNLSPLQNETGNPKRYIRYGFEKKRDHNML